MVRQHHRLGKAGVGGAIAQGQVLEELTPELGFEWQAGISHGGAGWLKDLLREERGQAQA